MLNSMSKSTKVLLSKGSFSGKDGFNCAGIIAEEGWSCMSSIATIGLTSLGFSLS
jgi:hypothetical protein